MAAGSCGEGAGDAAGDGPRPPGDAGALTWSEDEVGEYERFDRKLARDELPAFVEEVLRAPLLRAG